MIFIDHTKQFDLEGMEPGELFTHFAEKTRLPAAVRRGIYNKRLGYLFEFHILHEIDTIRNSFTSREIRIHPEFLDEAIPLYSDNIGNDEENNAVSIPAADRFVSVSDNQIDTSQAVAALDELTDAIRSSNDLTANAEDKAQISREISFLKEIIDQPRIHVAALWDGIKHNQTLQWLTKDAVSGIVRIKAVAAFNALTALLSDIWHHL